MALLWSKKTANTHYEVRSAGNSIRLYSNGIFHSQWNPNKPLSGHLWDLLSLPVFFHMSTQRVLLLGVGGGAAINTLNSLIQPSQIIGVDLDQNHLDIAKNFFGCNAGNIKLIHDDAQKFITSRAKSTKFDYIIEDLFAGSESAQNDARRAINATPDWLRQLSSRLRACGCLVMNFEDEQQLRQCVSEQTNNACGFEAIYSFRAQRYENAIGVFLKMNANLDTFKYNLQERLNSPLPNGIKLSPQQLLSPLTIKRLA